MMFSAYSLHRTARRIQAGTSTERWAQAAAISLISTTSGTTVVCSASCCMHDMYGSHTVCVTQL
eukprot:20389-Heterococcus_DN1.PRE.2